MQECHQTSCCAATRTGVQEPHAKPGKVVEALLHVIDRVRDVVQTAATLAEEVGDLRVGTCAAQELDTRQTDLEHRGLDAVAVDAIAVRGRCTCQSLVRRDRGVEIGDGDGDVVDPRENSHQQPSIGSRSLTGLQRSVPAKGCTGTHAYDRPVRLRRLLLGGLLVFTLGFAFFAFEHMFPPQPYGMADDWRVFYAASTVVQHGGNPYDATTIHAAEQVAEHYAGVQPSLDDFTDLPIVAVMLRAVTWLPFWWSYVAITAIGVVATVWALVRWIRESGWRGFGLWVVAAMCSWPVLLGFFSGQFDSLLLAATVASLVFMRRDRPVAAGLCMAAVLLKPHILWPLPLLLFAVWIPDRRAAWCFLTTAAVVVVSGAAMGFLLVPQSAGFVGHLLGFSSRVASFQPDLAGLPGTLLRLPGGSAAAVAVAGIGVAAVVALAVLAVIYEPLRRAAVRNRSLVPLVGLAVWLALTPYAHPNDDVLLFPLLVLLLGRDARDLSGQNLGAGVVAAAAVAAAFVAAPLIGAFVLAAGIGALALQRRRVTPELAAALALAAIALLPTLWPFHVLQVPVTPVAVALTAAAGLLHLRSRMREAVLPSVGQRERGGRLGGVVVETAPALAAETAGSH